MFEGIANFFKKLMKSESKQTPSKETAKERLHLVLMQDRANVSADFLELMKQEIIEVIKKYIEVEESAIDVRLTKEVKEDGSQGAPSLYANIPILNIKNDMKNEIKKESVADHGDPENEVDDKNAEVKEETEGNNNKEEIKENLEETPVGGDVPGDPKEEKTIEEKAEVEKEETPVEVDVQIDQIKQEDAKVEEESIKEEKTEENKVEENNSKNKNNN